ncbi:MAG TPA: hypothetical protein VIL25_02920 [Vicinamibacterales bacterium]
MPDAFMHARIADSRTGASTLTGKPLDPVDDEEPIAQFRRDVEQSGTDRLETDEADALSALLREQEAVYQESLIEARPQEDPRNRTGAAIRQAVRSQLLRQSAVARKLARLDAANVQKFHTVIHHPGHGGPRLPEGPRIDPVVAPDDTPAFDRREPPYDFPEASSPHAGLSFDHSFAVHQWGVVGHDVEFVHDQEYDDLIRPDFGYAVTDAHVGIRYRMPEAGRLDLTLVVHNLSSHVRYEIRDKLGPSRSYLDIEDRFFVRVSGPSGLHTDGVIPLDETIQTSDDRTGTVTDIAQGQRYVLNVRTGTGFAQGEEVNVLLASQLRIASTARLMRNRVSATVSWYLEGMYLRVI